MELGKMISEGAGHRVYEAPDDPNQLIKVPKRPYPIERVTADIEYCRRVFSEFIPETEIVPNPDSGYVIRQARIPNIEHITPTHLRGVEGLRDQVKTLFEINRKSLEENNVGIDAIGLEGSTKCACALIEKYRGGLWDKLVITPTIKSLLALKNRGIEIPVRDDTLDIWNQGDFEPEMSNVVFCREDGKVYLVDLSLVHTSSNYLPDRIRSFVLQKWNGHFLRRQFGIEL